MIYKEQFLKGAFGMKEYMTPDFDVTVYEIEDVITGILQACASNIGTPKPS